MHFHFLIRNRCNLSLFLYERSKYRITVKSTLCEAGNLLDCLADTDAETRQNRTNLLIGIRTSAGYNQSGKAVNHQPQIPEIPVKNQRLHQQHQPHQHCPLLQPALRSLLPPRVQKKIRIILSCHPDS